MSLDLQPIVPPSARRRSSRTLCSWLAPSWLSPLAACALLAAACGGDEASGEPDFGAGALGPFGGVGGSTSNPVAPGGSNNAVGNNNVPAATGTPNNNNEPNQGNGTPTANNNNNAANNNTGNNNTPSPAAGGAGGTQVGAAGSTANPPPTGAAGSGAVPPPPPPPPTGAAGSGAVTPPPVTPPPPAVPDIPCPAGATFCSGFESDTLPAGSSFQSNPPGQPQFDTAVKHSGNRSVLFAATGGGFNVREIIAPIPGQSFWVRLFIQTSDIFGDNNHDSLFVASTALPTEDNNAEDGPEFSEQGNQVLLNANDALRNANGPGFPQGAGPQLAADTWHCIEAHYDGGTGDVQIFNNGDPLIDAPGFARLTYETFRFGYIGFNTARDVWFDDVVVSANRVNCQ
jgi:hypothetical protein